MGYISTLTEYKQLRFFLREGATEDEILSKLTADARRDLRFWFDLEVDPEDGELHLIPQGEPGKAYWLEDTLKELLAVVNPLQRFERDDDLPGLRLNFELWGEEQGDFTFYGTDDEGLYAVRGKVSFAGERVRL